MADVGRDVAQHLPLRTGQHQIVPASSRFDALRQIVETRTRLDTTRFPQRSFLPSIPYLSSQHFGTGGTYTRRAQIELRYQGFYPSVQLLCHRSETVTPQASLLCRVRPVHVHAYGWPLSAMQGLAADHDDQAIYSFHEGESRTNILRAIQVLTVHQQSAAAQDSLALPEASQGFPLTCGDWDIGGTNGVQLHPERGTG